MPSSIPAQPLPSLACVPLARAAAAVLRVLLMAWLLVGSTPWAFDAARIQQAAQRIGPRALAALPGLMALLQPMPGMDDEARLDMVNSHFNRSIVFRSDAEVWGETDHWASPLELLDKGQGDCEDYAIAKYFTLLAQGMPVQRLRLVYVRAQSGGESTAHMVLAYYARPDAEPLILDNLVTSVRPASRRPDLTPVFSFNSEGLWQGVGAQSAGGDAQARLSRWREVLAKAKAEGFL